MEKLIEEFSLGLFFWQSLLFLGLLFLLRSFAWKPILEAINERETSIKDALSSAEKAKEEMQAVQADNKRILQEARAEKEALLSDAKKAATEMVNQAKDSAQGEADKILAQAQETIQAEKEAALKELKTQVAGLSLDIAQKVLQQELSDADKQADLVAKLLKESKL
jgi:F-type H+-transporting ATPase subunit b